LFAAEIVGHREQPGLDFALPLVLRVGIKFVACHDLGRDRRLVLTQFGRHQCGKFGIGQWLLTTFPPSAAGFFGRIRPKD